MASCPKCHADVTEGMPFCTHCGASMATLAPDAPAGSVPSKPGQPSGQPEHPATDEEALDLGEQIVEKPAAKPMQPSSVSPSDGFGGLDLEIPKTPSAELDEDEDPRRRISGAAGGIVCRFCKGPLSLEAGYCEYCGAPVEEAAPPGLIKPKPALPTAPAPTTGSPVSPPAAAKPSPQPPLKTPGAGPTAKTDAVEPSIRRSTAAIPPATASQAAGHRPATTAPTPVARKPRLAAAAMPAAAPPDTVVAGKRKLSPIVVILGITAILAAGGITAWWFLRPKPASQMPAGRVAPAPVPTQAPPSEAIPATGGPEVDAPASSAVSRPRTARVRKPAPPPAPAPPAASPEQARIVNLQNRAREAYAKGNYAEPASASAIAYAKQVLETNPNDEYAQRLLEASVHGGTFQVQQAIASKDFATARRIASVMAQLLPGRSDVAGLKEDIASAERRAGEVPRPPP